jgi:hypothetical protein
MTVQSKLLRLDKKQDMFRARAAEMLRRGLKSLDELEAVDTEAVQREPSDSDETPVNLIDYSRVAFDPRLAVWPSFWDDLGVSDGIPLGDPGI